MRQIQTMEGCIVKYCYGNHFSWYTAVNTTFLFMRQIQTMEGCIVKYCYGNHFSWYTAVNTNVF